MIWRKPRVLKNTILLCIIWSSCIYSFYFMNFYVVLIPSIDTYLTGVALFGSDVVACALAMTLTSFSLRNNFTILYSILTVSSFILHLSITRVNSKSEIDINSILEYVDGLLKS